MSKSKNKDISKEEKQNKITKKERRLLTINKVVNRISLAMSILMYFVFLGTLAILVLNQSNNEIASMVDFVLAALSIAILLLSCIHNERMIYIWVGSVTILVMSVVLIILIIVGIKLKVPSNVSRIMSALALLGAFAVQLKENIRVEYEFDVKNENKKEEEIKRIEQSNSMEYIVYEFCHSDKLFRKKCLKDFFKTQRIEFIVSYFFIFLSTSHHIISPTNGALWVFLWYTLSIFISWYMYISQLEYNDAIKRAEKFAKKHPITKVEKRKKYSVEIGGWNFKSAQLMSALVVVIVLSIFSFVKQNIDYSDYMENYKDFCVGIFADTYVLVFFTIYRSFIVELEKISGLKNKMTGFFHCFKGGKIKNLLIHTFCIVIIIGVMSYYFSNEFSGIFSNKLRKVLGVIYILYMLDMGHLIKKSIGKIRRIH